MLSHDLVHDASRLFRLLPRHPGPIALSPTSTSSGHERAPRPTEEPPVWIGNDAVTPPCDGLRTAALAGHSRRNGRTRPCLVHRRSGTLEARKTDGPTSAAPFARCPGSIYG